MVWMLQSFLIKSTFYSAACCSWMPSDYVDPCTPPSPSISLVHAYRDSELVSVPCNLLVQGDVVVLGPGHSAPAQVQQVELFTCTVKALLSPWVGGGGVI